MAEEIIQLCTPDGKPSGTAPRSICHSNPSMIQMVVHLQIINRKGGILLQKRAMDKEAWPGRWDTAVGGHVSAGEDLVTALKREAFEEIGIRIKEAEYLFSHLYSMEKETEMSFVFLIKHEGPFRIDNDEVTDARFFSEDEIRENLGKGFFTPNFEKQFSLIAGRLRTSA